MDRLGFLKRLGLFATAPIVAVASSITQNKTETVIDGDVRIIGKLTVLAPNNASPAFVVNPYQNKLITVVPNNTPIDTPLDLILGS